MAIYAGVVPRRAFTLGKEGIGVWVYGPAIKVDGKVVFGKQAEEIAVSMDTARRHAREVKERIMAEYLHANTEEECEDAKRG